MEVRPLHESEVPAFVDGLWVPFCREMAEHDPYHALADEYREGVIEFRRERLSDEDRIDRVAVVDDEFAGYVSAEVQEAPPVFAHDDTAHVNEIYVRPAFRREGIADELMAAAESWGEKRGCAHVTLTVDAWNESAQALYEDRAYDVKRHTMRKPLE
jgi:ribosomal protein S18 acetylase RimI-like enzyme